MGYIEKVVKHFYEGQSVRSYCSKNSLSYTYVYTRIKAGMSVEEAIKSAKLKYIKYEQVKDLSQISEIYRLKWSVADKPERDKIKKAFFRLEASEHILEKYWELIVFNKKQHDVKESELWKTIKGHENYQVSNFGRFRRKHNTSFAKYTEVKPYIKEGRCRKNAPIKKELVVNLGGKDKKAKIIVARAFIDNPDNCTCVKEIDGNRLNINVKNLKWLSASQYGKMTGYKSKSKPVIKVDPKTKKILSIYRSARQAGRSNGLSYQTVLDNCNKKTKITKKGLLFKWQKDKK